MSSQDAMDNGSASNGAAEERGVFWMGNKTLKIPMSLYEENRTKLLGRIREAVKEDTSMEAAGPLVVLLQGGSAGTRYCSDTENVFRQESYFSYLFGVTEPDFYGALDVQSGESILFMPRLPDSYAVWMGKLHTPEDFKAKYRVDRVEYVDEINETLKRIGGEYGLPTLLLLQGLNTDSGKETKPAAFKEMDGFVCNSSFLHPILSECRVVKSENELRVLRYSAAVSSDAHVAVMRSARPGIMEYEMESQFLSYCYSEGGCRHSAYTSICGCGPNSAVLHYGHAGAPNDRKLQDGDLALLDMGAEYACYGADITCTFPVNGKFTENQKMVYLAVLGAQKAVFGKMRAGVSWVDMHLLAERTILEHLLAGGVVKGGVEEMMSARVCAVFMPHGLGHFLGLDVHDVGGYNGDAKPRMKESGLKSLRTTRTLEAGMFITVEPGCYFIDALLLPALEDPVVSKYLVFERINELRGMGGVRLEDDVIVTETGIENVTKCPRELADVESVMSGGLWPSALGNLSL